MFLSFIPPKLEFGSPAVTQLLSGVNGQRDGTSKV